MNIINLFQSFNSAGAAGLLQFRVPGSQWIIGIQLGIDCLATATTPAAVALIQFSNDVTTIFTGGTQPLAAVRCRTSSALVSVSSANLWVPMQIRVGSNQDLYFVAHSEATSTGRATALLYLEDAR